MVVEYIRYRIEKHRSEDFVEAYGRASVALDESPVCLGYELSQCLEEPERYILRIEWTSTDDHLSKFRSSQQFREFLPHVRPYIESIEEMQHYEPTKVVALK